jgi:hypothetical protein
MRDLLRLSCFMVGGGGGCGGSFLLKAQSATLGSNKATHLADQEGILCIRRSWWSGGSGPHSSRLWCRWIYGTTNPGLDARTDLTI